MDALDEAIDRANRELAASNFTLVGLGVVGCHLARFERGGEVRTLEGATTPRLRFAHVSEHVLGTACDISYAWVRGGDGVVRGFSVHMFQLALLDPDDARYDPSPAHFAKWRREINRSGESAYFHALGAALPKPAPELVDHVLLIGVTLRNALLDAGLVVYTPATNSAHWNHFHVHLPVETNVWTETSRDETTRARREELVAPALRRAAGLDPATALAPPGDVLVRGRTVRVIKAVAEDGGTLIMIAAGAKDEVEQGDRGVLLDDDGRAVPGGAFRIVRVTARVAYARVALPMSQVSASPNARLAR